MRQKLKLFLLVFSLAMSFLSVGIASAAKIDCDGGVDKNDPTKCANVSADQCASGKVSDDPTKCAPLGSCGKDNETNCIAKNPIYKDLNIVIKFLGGLVALAVIGNIIVGGIQYSMAGGSPDKLSSARKRVANSVMAFLLFLFIFGFLQWLIPGGIFNA